MLLRGKNIIKILLIGGMTLSLVSCGAYKKLPYLKDADQLSSEQLLSSAELYEAKIMPKDVLGITVNSITPGAAKDFNLPLAPSGGKEINPQFVSTTVSETGTLQNYIVDNEGYITMPVIGRIKVGDLTKRKAEEYIASLIYPQYLKENPIVNIRFLNYRVTVLGEVARPGVYSVDSERITLFDALANAGDLTIYGRRDNVKLLRTKSNGEPEIHIINLQDKNILLNKEIYYLQQNDKIFVEANKARGNSSSLGSTESVAISAGLTTLSVIITVISILTR